MYQETFVELPSLKEPVLTTRSLTVMEQKRNGKPIPLTDVRLVVLVNGSLYCVMDDEQGLRAGEILSRNLDQTRLKGLDQTDLAQQLFYRYASLYDARRGIGRIRYRYDHIERPVLFESERKAQELMSLSWELCQAGDEHDRQFELVAKACVQRHARDRADLKVDACKKFAIAATRLDVTGRRNTGAIPLRMVATKRLLAQRMVDGTRIGRRMDWRSRVLDHYLNQLLRECRLISLGAEDTLVSNDLKEGKDRTPRALKTRAERMRSYASVLRTIRARPFYRVFTHVANELDQASVLLDSAVELRSDEPIEEAKKLLIRIYESMILAEQHWWIQELLIHVSRHYHAKKPFTPQQAQKHVREILAILSDLNKTCRFTGSVIGQSLESNIVPYVRGRLGAAKSELIKVANATPGQESDAANLKRIYDCLKEACRPL